MRILNDELIEYIYISIDDEKPRNTTVMLTGSGKQSLIKFIPYEVIHEEYPDKFGGKIVLKFRKEVKQEEEYESVGDVEEEEIPDGTEEDSYLHE